MRAKENTESDGAICPFTRNVLRSQLVTSTTKTHQLKYVSISWALSQPNDLQEMERLRRDLRDLTDANWELQGKNTTFFVVVFLPIKPNSRYTPYRYA